MFKKFIKEIFKCRHKNAILYSNEGYCPDCGKYLKKTYYIVRCACCDIKRHAKKNFDVIAPVEKFCTNCGCHDYIIEKYEKLNLVDINYAIEVKEAIENEGAINEIEIWIDDNKEAPSNGRQKENLPLIGKVKYLGAG
ncbi:MAG: hypothetical protein Q4F80_05105 [bacterium]|nr:hypothetical protein [bacterium]